MPDLDVVIAITADTGNMQKSLNVIWVNLLSAIGGVALPENPKARAKLKEIMAKLAVRTGHVDRRIDLPGI